jgi:hypothetical protein
VTVIRLTIALLVLVSAGWGVTVLLAGRNVRLRSFEVAACAWLFGTGAVSLSLWIGGLLFEGSVLVAVVTVVCLLVAAAGWAKVRSAQIRCSIGWPTAALEWTFLLIITAQIVTVSFSAFRQPLGWDGLLIWEAKARYAFLARGTLPSAYFQNQSWGHTHPEYPLLIPFTELWCYLWLGEANQFWVKAIFPLFYCSAVLLLISLGMRLTGRSWIGGLSAVMIFFIPYLHSTDGGVVVGYADFPLSVFYLASIGYFVVALTAERAGAFQFGAIAMALLPWVKREGIILWVCAAGCAALIAWRRRKPSLLLWLVPGLVILLGWRLYLISQCVVVPAEYSRVTVSTIADNAGRVPSILFALLAEMGALDHWSIFWPILMGASAFFVLRARNARLVMLTLALVVPLAGYGAAYVFSAWPNYHAHIASSLPRLFLQLMLLGWLLMQLAAGKALQRHGMLREEF